LSVKANDVSEEVSAGRVSEEDAARTERSKLQMKIPFGGWNDNIKVDLQVTWHDGVEQIQRVQNMAE
jgi:hypothetical protein